MENKHLMEIYPMFFLAYPSVQQQEKRIVPIQGVPLNVKVESLNRDTAIMGWEQKGEKWSQRVPLVPLA